MAGFTTARLERNGRVLIGTVELAHGLLERMRGLLGRRDLPVDRGIHLEPCPAIHTVGMCFRLDVVFLDRNRRVVRIARNVRPFRIVTGGPAAHSAIEVASGWFAADALRIGDILTLATDP